MNTTYVANPTPYKVLFNGKTKRDGFLSLSAGSSRFLVQGRLMVASSNKAGRIVFVERPPRIQTAGEQSSDLGDRIEVLARGRRTGKLYAISGVIVKAFSRIPKKQAQRMSSEDYRDEMSRIKSAHDANLDPLVNIRFIARHTGRGISTIYRDMNGGRLQKPLKQGKTSQWPFSAVDAYAHGKEPPSKAPNADHEKAL